MNRSQGFFGAVPADYLVCQQKLKELLGFSNLEKKRGIGIGQGCSNFGRERMFSADQWVKIIQKRLLKEPELVLNFLGSTTDYKLAENTISQLKEQFPSVIICINHCGKLNLSKSILLLA